MPIKRKDIKWYNHLKNWYWKFGVHIKAICWLIVELKEKYSILDRILNPGLLVYRANALTNWAIQDKYQSTTELIS